MDRTMEFGSAIVHDEDNGPLGSNSDSTSWGFSNPSTAFTSRGILVPLSPSLLLPPPPPPPPAPDDERLQVAAHDTFKRVP
jgi:hypothetical protein